MTTATLADDTYLAHAVLDRLANRALAQPATNHLALPRLTQQVMALATAQGLGFSPEDIRQAAQEVLGGGLTTASEQALDWSSIPVEPEARAAALVADCQNQPKKWWHWKKVTDVVDVRAICKRLDIAIEQNWKINNHTGFSSWQPPKAGKGPLIIFDSETIRRTLWAQDNFAIAHQLGHLLLGHRPRPGCSCALSSRLEPEMEGMPEKGWPAWRPCGIDGVEKPEPLLADEEAADRFAGALLMPTGTLAVNLKLGWSVATLARHYRVPVSAVRQRLGFLANQAL